MAEGYISDQLSVSEQSPSSLVLDIEINNQPTKKTKVYTTSKTISRPLNITTSTNKLLNTKDKIISTSQHHVMKQNGSNTIIKMETKQNKNVMKSITTNAEVEIAKFSAILDDMLARVSCRELVNKTAMYIKQYPEHSIRFQIKMKQRSLIELPKQFQAKLMLFYVLHEYFKSYEDTQERRCIEKQWYDTVDTILHACVRDMRHIEDQRKRLYKTLARWEELGLYPGNIKSWKGMVMGEKKTRRAPSRLPKNETEHMAMKNQSLDNLANSTNDDFLPPPPSVVPAIWLNRRNYAYLFERSKDSFRCALDRKLHWRLTGIAFVNALVQCLGLNPDIACTASNYFHRVFDRGIYAKERYKFAAASVFLSAKAASKRMKLVLVVRTMYDILERPLLLGDEELLELERMHLLHYEVKVLEGIDYELTVEVPLDMVLQMSRNIPTEFRDEVCEEATNIILELYWLPLCIDTPPLILAEAAIYIACQLCNRRFSFTWCQDQLENGERLTERQGRSIYAEYNDLCEWKKSQLMQLEALEKQSEREKQTALDNQRGGLWLDLLTIELPDEYTKKGVNEEKESDYRVIDRNGRDIIKEEVTIKTERVSYSSSTHTSNDYDRRYSSNRISPSHSNSRDRISPNRSRRERSPYSDTKRYSHSSSKSDYHDSSRSRSHREKDKSTSSSRKYDSSGRSYYDNYSDDSYEKSSNRKRYSSQRHRSDREESSSSSKRSRKRSSSPSHSSSRRRGRNEKSPPSKRSRSGRRDHNENDKYSNDGYDDKYSDRHSYSRKSSKESRRSSTKYRDER